MAQVDQPILLPAARRDQPVPAGYEHDDQPARCPGGAHVEGGPGEVDSAGKGREV